MLKDIIFRIFRNTPFLPLIYKLNEKIHVTMLYRKAKARLRVFYRKQLNKAITKERIINDLRNLGLNEGDVVLVHSSLSRIGYVEGGVDTVIDALLETVGNTGTILVPTLTYGAKELLSDNPPIFDPQRTPCNTGKIPETFRQRKGAVRSVHPTHSVAAIGPHTEYLLKDAESSQTPCGKNSPFYKLIELDGYILLLGTTFAQLTSGHVIEDAVPDFPVEVYLKEPVEARYLDNNGIEKTTMLKLHDPKVALRRWGSRKEKEQEIFGHCLRRGIINTGYIGAGKSYLLKARELENTLEDLLSQGIVTYVPE